MTTIIYAWRAILWSWVAANASSRRYMDADGAMGQADKIVKGFNERFEITITGSFRNKPPQEPKPIVTYKEEKDGR